MVKYLKKKYITTCRTDFKNNKKIYNFFLIIFYLNENMAFIFIYNLRSLLFFIDIIVMVINN